MIKGLVEILSFDYGVKTIYGIRYGYAGLTPRGNQEPLLLGPDEVDTIHEIGGTILGSARGQPPTEDIVGVRERGVGRDEARVAPHELHEPHAVHRALRLGVRAADDVRRLNEGRLETEGRTHELEVVVDRASGKTHTVVVVAEGAGQRLMKDEGSAGTDASGNVLKKDIGEFLKRQISAHFKARGIPASVKYFDPSYMIRSVPARGSDAIRCYMLARNAVHAAMAGRTNCVVGSVGDNYTLVPIRLATIERQQVRLDGDLWRSVMDATGQEFYFNGSAGALDVAP